MISEFNIVMFVTNPFAHAHRSTAGERLAAAASYIYGDRWISLDFSFTFGFYWKNIYIQQQYITHEILLQITTMSVTCFSSLAMFVVKCGYFIFIIFVLLRYKTVFCVLDRCVTIYLWYYIEPFEVSDYLHIRDG